MKALDKIIVVQYEDGELSEHWCKENRTDNISIEYIRKDALLEWAKMKKDHIKIVDWDADYYFGLDFMLDELIDKLNSM